MRYSLAWYLLVQLHVKKFYQTLDIRRLHAWRLSSDSSESCLFSTGCEGDHTLYQEILSLHLPRERYTFYYWCHVRGISPIKASVHQMVDFIFLQREKGFSVPIIKDIVLPLVVAFSLAGTPPRAQYFVVVGGLACCKDDLGCFQIGATMLERSGLSFQTKAGQYAVC